MERFVPPPLRRYVAFHDVPTMTGNRVAGIAVPQGESQIWTVLQPIQNWMRYPLPLSILKQKGAASRNACAPFGEFMLPVRDNSLR